MSTFAPPTISDLVAGSVTAYNAAGDSFGLRLSDGRELQAFFTPTTFAELLRNLGEPYQDCTGQVRDMLTPGRFLFAYGVLYTDGPEGTRFEAKHLVLVGRGEAEFLFEKQDWWTKQLRQLADFYLKFEFGDGGIDYARYRTDLGPTGDRMGVRQETDTISRLVYGFATTYLLTGEDRFLEAAEKGTQYLRDHMRFLDRGEGICYWYHAVDIKSDGSEQKIFASEFGDDYDAIPCYEQIYALAGPVQTFRVTGDPQILDDARLTLRLFERHFKDTSAAGGYFSHIDPITLSPTAESLGHNRARKNWNSNGDHAPAYLINLLLATGDPGYAKFLEYTFDTVAKHFPDYDRSPFVQERFLADWTHDTTWGWQQNRAVVGHNLKIAWNMMRLYNLKSKPEYVALARKIAEVLPEAGGDRQRGGWYDVVERALAPGQGFHRFVWHDRKAWWQQEQGILAYLILQGVLGDPDYQKWARLSAAFYNAWFLDTQSGGVYFNVLANGQPYDLGTERDKGSHSMAGYHSFELCYLAAVYTNLLVTKQPLDLYFKPTAGAWPDNLLRVAPDLLPPGSVRIAQVWVDGKPYADFDARTLTVRLPQDHGDLRVRVQLVPASQEFAIDLLGVEGSAARLSLTGDLSADSVLELQQTLTQALALGATSLVFVLAGASALSSELLRELLFIKQQQDPGFALVFEGASDTVRAALLESALLEEATLAAV